RGDPPGKFARRSLLGKGRRRRGSHAQAALAGGERPVNSQHFRAFLWLRWRLRVNQLRRGGIGNIVILALLATAGVLLALGLFALALLIGIAELPNAAPPILMYVWDGLLLAFLFCWLVGIMTDLQRSESLSLNKFLHLPVSLSGAFLINYVSSLLSFN